MQEVKALEALLFLSGEALSFKELARLLNTDKKGIETALEEFERALETRGLGLLRHGEEVSLVTRPEVSDVAEKLAREKLEGDLSRAALEVLAIVLWKEEVSRASIDYIRGVNSSFSLRALLLRGLVERHPNPKDSRTYLYRPTADLFKYLGIHSSKELPNWAEIAQHVE